jgi:hypothetical protein
MTKCKADVRPAKTPAKTRAIRLNTLAPAPAHACTETISATNSGISERISISRKENSGSGIGCCSDRSDKRPAISVATYTAPRKAVPLAATIPTRRALFVNVRPTVTPQSLPDADLHAPFLSGKPGWDRSRA